MEYSIRPDRTFWRGDMRIDATSLPGFFKLAGLAPGDVVRNLGAYPLRLSDRMIGNYAWPAAMSGTTGAPITITGGSFEALPDAWLDKFCLIRAASHLRWLDVNVINVRNPFLLFAEAGLPGPSELVFENVAVFNCGRRDGVVFSGNGRGFDVANYGAAGEGPERITFLNCRVYGGSELGFAVRGDCREIGLVDCFANEIDDGRGTSGDGDGFRLDARSNGAPSNVAFTHCIARGVSEDGFDLTGTGVTLAACRATDAGACGVKLWRRSWSEHATYMIRDLTAEGHQVGLEINGRPDVDLDGASLVGDTEPALFAKAVSAFGEPPGAFTNTLRLRNILKADGGVVVREYPGQTVVRDGDEPQPEPPPAPVEKPIAGRVVIDGTEWDLTGTLRAAGG